MANTVVKNELPSVGDYGQYAPIQANRTNYTPGKTNPFAGEANVGAEIPVKTGIPAIDALGIMYTRIANVSEGVINQTEAPVPVITGTKTETITAQDGSLTGSHAVTQNTLPTFNLERNVAGNQA